MRNSTRTRILTVGNVAVDSGVLTVCDPMYLNAVPDPYLPVCTIGQLHLSDGISFAVTIPVNDGLYPAFLEYDGDGSPARLVVDLDPAPSDEEIEMGLARPR